MYAIKPTSGRATFKDTNMLSNEWTPYTTIKALLRLRECTGTLICVFVVLISRKQVFLWRGSFILHIVSLILRVCVCLAVFSCFRSYQSAVSKYALKWACILCPIWGVLVGGVGRGGERGNSLYGSMYRCASGMPPPFQAWEYMNISIGILFHPKICESSQVFRARCMDAQISFTRIAKTIIYSLKISKYCPVLL